ncbi:radical SAM protein [uncultured Selenomonas sp.]|uniref:radical SAM protein n=1 Tax=uncultured Selenomonas sp. TaxID=159275 RepID=UPI0028E332EE|nr:radical SAM protein [uncultured Selenomonas sp.]
MRVGLVDVDGHNFPNLVLMKLSAWHKHQGDCVHLLRPDDVLLGGDLFGGHDKLYAACVFTENRHVARRLEEIGAQIGGTGTGRPQTLPPEIEHIYPDYALYGDTKTAYGFLTRGCPRACPFCIVASKEGRISRKVADLGEFWSGERYIKLLDPNLLAAAEHMELLQQIVASGAWVDFTQGLDARLLTAENIDLINACKVKMLHFAWDNPRDEIVPKMLEMFAERSAVTDYRKRKVYVLTNYWSTHEEDLRRVCWLREHGYDAYVMIYDKQRAPKETRRLQRWTNNKIIFRSCERFEDYRG